MCCPQRDKNEREEGKIEKKVTNATMLRHHPCFV